MFFHSMTRRPAVSVAMVITLSALIHSQSLGQVTPERSPAGAVAVTDKMTDESAAQIRRLEDRIAEMQKQIDALRAAIEPRPVAPSVSASATSSAGKPATVEVPKTAVQAKQLGVDLGPARLTPYGTIYFNAFGNSRGVNNSDVPLFATATGMANASASVRQTRLGLRLDGLRVGSASMKAVLEADFFGGFPAVGIGENFGIVRLRLANARLDWEKTSVTLGQDWMVFAPVNPTSLAAAAIPQMAAAGNPWARIPQIKVERKLGSHLTLAGAALAPQTGDYAIASSFFLQPTSGAVSRVPFVQTRLAYADANWLGTKKAGYIGLSGHYGRSKVFTGPTANIENDVDSTGVALDWSFPLAKRLAVSGEAFFGRNLGGFQTGVFQSYNNDFAHRVGTTLVAAGVRSIGTRGGWMQIAFTPDVLKDRLAIYGSVGIDDPRNGDLLARTQRDFRTQNLAYAANSIFKVTPQFALSAEFRRFRTTSLLTGRRTADHLNLAAAYTF